MPNEAYYKEQRSSLGLHEMKGTLLGTAVPIKCVTESMLIKTSNCKSYEQKKLKVTAISRCIGLRNSVISPDRPMFSLKYQVVI